MGSKSLIAIARFSDKIEYIYCNFDGYVVRGVGETLIKEYNSLEKVGELISGGDCSTLVDERIPFSDVRCCKSPRDRVTRFISIEDYVVGLFNTRFIYLFKNDEWYFKDEFLSEWVLITEYLKNVKVCQIYY